MRASLVLVLGLARSDACSSDRDCNLNGLCSSGSCQCDPAWHGEDCGVLDVKPNSARRIYSDSASSWGGLPVWDADTQMYHLFASEFANNCSLGQWSPNSQVIRATSKSLTGPFERQEVVLPPFHHNPTLTHASDGTWLLYAIGRDVSSSSLVNCSQLGGDPAPGNLESNITLFASQALTGPWQRVGVVLAGDDQPSAAWDADRTNPSAFALPNGQVQLMYRGCGWQCLGGEYIGLTVAPHWNCPVDGSCRYEKTTTSKSSPLWKDATSEDPFLFRDRRGGWHALLHNLGRNGGFGCNNETWAGCDVGGHAFSQDGVHWTLSSTIPFTTNVTWSDGQAETLNRRERPQLVMAADGVTPIALVNGAQKNDVPASCSEGGTVVDKECRSFTLLVELSSPRQLV